MNKYIKNILTILVFLIPYLLIYKVFFISGSLAFGDAPFFTPGNLKELFNLPFTWNFRNDNFGLSQFYILWLYLPTYLYGLLNHYLGLGNDILIRLIFYFPATILAIVGSWKFIGRFNQNIYGKFLGSFFYGFNTYFLMLIDGGQVGVVLAYGLFPIAVLCLFNYLDKISLKKYIYSLIISFILFNTDIRIGLIAILLSFLIWLIVKREKKLITLLRSFLILGFSILGLTLFWILPTLLNFSSNNFTNIGTNNNFINLTNSFFLFQPHFPLNRFGYLSPTPFYFCFLLIIIFGNLFFLSKFKKTENRFILKLSLLFLLFVFIAKGGSNPLGEIFIWIINHVPGGVAFRDASKFYIPLILIGGLLLSFTTRGLKKIIKNKLMWKIFVVGVYGYLMILIYPAISGNLSGVLGQPSKLKDNDYQQIFNKLSKEQGFFRSLYIEEKPAKFYSTFEKPAISANSLYKERPFASMIVGKYDLYNFLHSQQLRQWFNLLGIKYVFLPENERKKILSLQEQKDRNVFLSFIEEVPNLQTLDWQTSFPVYEISGQALPHIFAQKKAFFIVGGEQIYKQLFNVSDFKLQNQGFVFLEDGRIDPKHLQEINPKDMLLIFNKKNITDLLMSYFQKEIISTNISFENQWKFRSSDDYLTWKYDLLVNDIESYEFDYGKGISFSTIANEKIKFKLNIPKNDNYYLIIRYTNATSSAGIKVVALNKNYDLLNNKPSIFKWNIIGPINLKQGDLPLEIINKGGFVMVNTLGIISENDYKKKEQEVNDLVNKRETIYIKEDKDILKVIPFLQQDYLAVDYKQINPTKYVINNLPKDAKWLIFSDHYHIDWNINKDNSIQFPFYAMINGFYINKSTENINIIFTKQEEIPKSIILSISSVAIILLSVLFIFKIKKRKNK